MQINPTLQISHCRCGSIDFHLVSEKLYEGYVEDGILKCEPDSEDIIEIKCRNCQRRYDVDSFKEISY